VEELRAVLDALPASGPAAGTADAIAKQAGVGRRRTQVILHLLREAGVIRRGGRGYLRGAGEVSDKVLEELLQTYVERAQNDKDRLAEMMHYAETARCRTQVIRAYFGDAEDEPCMHCDNCVARSAASTETPKPVATSTSLKMEAAVLSAETQGSGVTRVETMHGEILTTAPETLPRKEEPAAFVPGDQVRHRRFGAGKVIDIHDANVLVEFEKVGKKRLRADFLTAVA
jgi:ATP-dependent DNA helicase RecQ